MNFDTLNSIYTILVETCGARPEERVQFVRADLDSERAGEWRFQGHLGFGGKFRSYPGRPPYVDCYREDMTPERQAIIDRANQQLAAFGKCL